MGSQAGDADKRGSFLGAARKHRLLSGLWVNEGLIRRQKLHLQCLCSLLLKHQHRKKKKKSIQNGKGVGCASSYHLLGSALHFHLSSSWLNLIPNFGPKYFPFKKFKILVTL